MQYVRDTYDVPVKRGQKVRPLAGRMKHEHLTVTSCSHYVHARRELTETVHRFHPHDLEYLTAGSWVQRVASP